MNVERCRVKYATDSGTWYAAVAGSRVLTFCQPPRIGGTGNAIHAWPIDSFDRIPADPAERREMFDILAAGPCAQFAALGRHTPM